MLEINHLGLFWVSKATTSQPHFLVEDRTALLSVPGSTVLWHPAPLAMPCPGRTREGFLRADGEAGGLRGSPGQGWMLCCTPRPDD